MNTKANVTDHSSFDVVKWLFATGLVIAGLWANYHYSQVDWALRAAGWIVLFCVAALIAFQTAQGKRLWLFIKESRSELRKVVWPTRQETMQTTLLIVVMVVVMALILWGIDSVLMWIVGWLTGQRG
jgi:preprotein translocase subunit SecE